MAEKMRICISSPPDRNKLVAEIFFGSIQWAKINQENNFYEVEFYPRPDNKPWQLKVSTALEALNDAIARLKE